ncbi:MAG: PTS sugar transporter subunit IIA [Spirochaetota bacterium]
MLDESCVKLEIAARRKPEIIRELVEVLASAGKISDADEVTRRVVEREEMTTTGIGGGIAIPHCLSAAAPETTLAFGRSTRGAKFDAVDKRPVRLFFLMVGPPGAHNDHLRLLSRLARYLHDPELKQTLLDAEDAATVVSVFAERET